MLYVSRIWSLGRSASAAYFCSEATFVACVQGSGFRVQGSGFRVRGSGYRVQGSGFRVQGLGDDVVLFGEMRVQGLGSMVQGFGRREGVGFRV